MTTGSTYVLDRELQLRPVLMLLPWLVYGNDLFQNRVNIIV